MDLDALYYSDQQVQKNIEIRSQLPGKGKRQQEELEAKKWWLLNKGISKVEIEKTYGKFQTYVYHNKL